MIIPATLGALASLVAAYCWLKFGQRWTPDYELYTQGGFGLYPSPVGRLLGMVEPVFVSASVAAAGVSVYCAALTRGKTLSGSATPRSLVLAASPVLLYLTFASADVIALGLYAMWLASSRHWLLALGVFTHFALLPYALLHLAASKTMTGTQKLVAGYFLGGTIAIVLMVTPYGGIVFVDAGFWSAASYGLALGALVALPALVFFRLGPIHWLAFAVGAAECGLQNHAQARYFLPAILLLAATGKPRSLDTIRRLWYSLSYAYFTRTSQVARQARAARALDHLQADYTRAGSPRRRRGTPRNHRVPGDPLEVRLCNLTTDALRSADAPQVKGRQRVGQVPAAYATFRKEP